MKVLLCFLTAALLAVSSASAKSPAPSQAMIAVADARAAAAGKAMLDQGGNAVDAAIAAMAVLGLVEPQSAGVGGGGFLVTYDHGRREVLAYDGREAAPAAATGALFIGDDGAPLPFPQAVASGRSVGSPSLFAMLKLAHDKQGKLAWRKLFDPAIKLAQDGFVVSPRLAKSIAFMASRGALKQDPQTRAYLFSPTGEPLPAGFVRTNPDYAATLRAIAARGPKALQEGAIADAIIAATRQTPRPGVLTKADLERVKVGLSDALCAPYRTFTVCGAPPPTSGGVTLIDTLDLFERARPRPVGPDDPDDWAAFLWATRLAYADRNFYLADPAKAPVPVRGLISSAYLDQRAKLIDLASAAPDRLDPGAPPGAPIDLWAAPAPAREGGTTHLSIVDKNGDAAALTASVEAPFGSERMAAGFLLNNQLTDFSFVPERGGKPVANAAAPGKRPLSTMAPTMIFDAEGKLFAVIGSPGGTAIVPYVAKTIIGLIDWRLTMQQAIDLPNVIATSPRVAVERDRFPSGAAAVLSARGWTLIQSGDEASGLNGIKVTPDGLEGGSDPRREGVALRD